MFDVHDVDELAMMLNILNWCFRIMDSKENGEGQKGSKPSGKTGESKREERARGKDDRRYDSRDSGRKGTPDRSKKELPGLKYGSKKNEAGAGDYRDRYRQLFE